MNLKNLFSTALLVPIIACSATDTTKLSQAETNTDKLANINTYGCKNLHKVTDIDDLLKQMYDNIDSHCLFEMDIDDLEKVWGIKIFSDQKGIRDEEYKQYKKQANAFYLLKVDYRKRGNSFTVRFTDKFSNDYKKKGSVWSQSSLGSGKFPFYLPNKPFAIKSNAFHQKFVSDDIFKDSDYQQNTSYYWLNSDKSINKPFLHIEVWTNPSITSIEFYKDVPVDAPAYREMFGYTEF